MANFIDNSVGYGLQNALQTLAPQPIAAKRDPLATDRAAIGQVWVNTPTQTAFICAGTVANVTTWNQVAVGGGADTFATIHVTGVSTLDGNVVGGAAIGAATTLTAGTGLTVTTGNALVTAGKLTAVSLYASGDSGAGVAAQTAITNVTLAAAANVNTLAGGGGAGNPNTGYLKIYVGTTVCYIPYWTAAVV